MFNKADNNGTRRMNRALILEAIRSGGPMARTEIGHITGLSPATVTTISAKLIGEKAIIELNSEPDHGLQIIRGRPLVRVALNPNAARILAVKISIDSIELALADFTGKIISRSDLSPSTYDMACADVAEFLILAIRALLAENDLASRDIARIGIASQGLVDSRNGVILWSPAFRNQNIAVISPIEKSLGISCTVANDTNMIAEGLISRKRNNFMGNAVIVFIGYGVGMGLIIDGKIYHGTSGAAAEFGHMNHTPNGAMCRCGRSGCIEAYVSDYGIVRSASEPADNAEPPTRSIEPSIMQALEAAARRGDKAQVAAYQTAGRALGFGLARIIALLNPSRIVLAGPGISAFDLMAPAMNAAIEEGVIDKLHCQVKIETVPIGIDMIFAGTIDTTLRQLDAEVFAIGPDHEHDIVDDYRPQAPKSVPQISAKTLMNR